MRFFSVLAVLVGLALAAKLGGIWHDRVAQAESGGSAVAQGEAGTTESATGNAEVADAPPAPAAAQADATAPGMPGSDPAAGRDSAAEQAETAVLTADPFSLTDQEIELLQSLAKRRRGLEKRAGEIDQREIVLQAAEQRIDEKLAELNEIKATIETLLARYDEQEQAKLDSLVRIYESMKPKDAARIFEELDMDVLLQVVERMKERKTAPILAEMNPDRAKAITVELAQRRELPIARE